MAALALSVGERLSLSVSVGELLRDGSALSVGLGVGDSLRVGVGVKFGELVTLRTGIFTHVTDIQSASRFMAHSSV
jgi:hypothetical protein